MNPDDGSAREMRGPIAYMARNGVAANFLMLLIVAVGLVSLTGLVKEAYPVLNFDAVEVSVAYPGATPAEVEKSIVLKVEERLETLDAVDRVTAVAAQGMASVIAELKSGEDVDRSVDDIAAAVGRIQTLPAAAERPVVREMTHRQSVIRAVLHGDISERALKELAYRIEDELASLPLVSYVETSGVRDYEISIEVPVVRLRALGLTLDDVAAAIRSGSLELSGGSVETRDAEVLVRTVGQSHTQHDFEDIVVLSGSDGTMVRLGDIAEVRDGFRNVGLIVRHDGQPAAFVEVYRVAGEQIQDVARAVERHLDQRIGPSLPPGVSLTIWNNDARVYEERLGLLVDNGFQGLVLVLLIMTLFLQVRLAVWVALGIGISFIGTAATMLVLDVSVNTVSLFAFILAVGIVVDDAVVVAESVHLERRKGTRADLAAIRGTRRIRKPLIFAVFTTVVAVVPLLFVPGPVGALLSSVPIILISVLVISLLESLLILPNHLSHLPGPDWEPSHPLERLVLGIQARVDDLVRWFVDGPLDRGLRLATGQPAMVLAGAAGAVVLVVALIPAGIVDVLDAPRVEGDVVTARLEMPKGTPARRTHELAADLEAAGRRAVERLELDRSAAATPLLIGVNLFVGMEPRADLGSLAPEPGLNPQSHIAIVELRLVPESQREGISAGDVQGAWLDEAGEVPEAQALTLSSTVFDFGKPIHVELSHADPDRIGPVAEALAERLRELQGVFDIQSDHTEGLQEIQLGLRRDARTLGLTLESLAGQVRSAFFGREALRVQRGREDVRVYVRLPAAERDNVADLETYLIRAPSGGEVPLSRVADLVSSDAPSSIRRTDGRRVVTVTADVDLAVVTPAEVAADLTDTILPELQARAPGLDYAFGGRQQRQADLFGSMGRGSVIALVVMYGLLAIPLGSYGRPLIVMAVIPFGVVGAILGHMVMGLGMSPESFLGVIGLSGIVVNDSLVMLDFIDRRLKEGAPVQVAVMDGAKGRFRPIFLTSATTFLGFAPLIFDQSTQARFLSPLAVSLGGGILVATATVMVLVPALATVSLRAQRREGAGSSPVQSAVETYAAAGRHG